MISSGPVKVTRFILSDGSGFTFPMNARVLYSEVVVNSDGDEILELWLAVPTNLEVSTDYTSSGTRTVYNKTTIFEEDDYEDDEDDLAFDRRYTEDVEEPVDDSDLRRQIEREVADSLNDAEGDYYYD